MINTIQFNGYAAAAAPAGRAEQKKEQAQPATPPDVFTKSAPTFQGSYMVVRTVLENNEREKQQKARANALKPQYPAKNIRFSGNSNSTPTPSMLDEAEARLHKILNHPNKTDEAVIQALNNVANHKTLDKKNKGVSDKFEMVTTGIVGLAGTALTSLEPVSGAGVTLASPFAGKKVGDFINKEFSSPHLNGKYVDSDIFYNATNGIDLDLWDGQKSIEEMRQWREECMLGAVLNRIVSGGTIFRNGTAHIFDQKGDCITISGLSKEKQEEFKKRHWALYENRDACYPSNCSDSQKRHTLLMELKPYVKADNRPV